MSIPLVAPLFPKGKEPLPPGISEEERENWNTAQKYQNWMTVGMESCAAKTVIAGVGGFGIGAFFSLMSASFAYEDPYLRAQTQAAAAGVSPGAGTAGLPPGAAQAAQLGNTQKAREIFKEMGRGMYRSGKGFGKVGALFAGIECVIEGYRAKNDMVNPVAAGFFAGGILARNSGPKAVLGGGAAFAAFSFAIDLFLRRETPDDD